MEPFDPVAESIVLPQQKKKKAAKKKKLRPSNVTVIMMEEYCPVIPKGKIRHKLASSGKIQTIKFYRTMEVKNQLIRAFKVRGFVVESLMPSNAWRLK